jgi:hypothetical protein
VKIYSKFTGFVELMVWLKEEIFSKSIEFDDMLTLMSVVESVLKVKLEREYTVTGVSPAISHDCA